MIIKRHEKISDVLLHYGGDLIQFDFLALIYSSWHLNNLTVFITQRGLKNGLILILPQSNIRDETKFRLDESNFKNDCFSNCTLVFINTSHSKINLKNLLNRLAINSKETHNPFYLVSPGSINFKVFSSITLTIRRIILVIIDEGTGSYISTAQQKLFKYSIDSEKQTRKIKYQYFIDIIIDKLKSGYLKLSKSEIVDNLLFQRSKKSISPNTNLAIGLESYYYSNSEKLPYSNNILLFKDYSILEDETLEDFYINLFKQLSKRDLNIIIKKHPNDTGKFFNEYIKPINNVEIIEYSESGEQLIADLKPRFVIGGFSTVLFTCAAIFNIRTFSYMTIYLTNPKLSKRHTMIIEYFYELFKSLNKNLIFIDKLEDLSDISIQKNK